MSIFIKLIIAILICTVSLWALPSFPGAEGWGGENVGGRGGQVIKVTNLNSYGAGSMAQASNGISNTPPMEKPSIAIAIATVRRRRNQLFNTVIIGIQVPSPAPTLIITKDR